MAGKRGTHHPTTLLILGRNKSPREQEEPAPWQVWIGRVCQLQGLPELSSTEVGSRLVRRRGAERSPSFACNSGSTVNREDKLKLH